MDRRAVDRRRRTPPKRRRAAAATACLQRARRSRPPPAFEGGLSVRVARRRRRRRLDVVREIESAAPPSAPTSKAFPMPSASRSITQLAVEGALVVQLPSWRPHGASDCRSSREAADFCAICTRGGRWSRTGSIFHVGAGLDFSCTSGTRRAEGDRPAGRRAKSSGARAEWPSTIVRIRRRRRVALREVLANGCAAALV